MVFCVALILKQTNLKVDSLPCSGFMRRPDADSLRNSLPIGVLPVGKSNRFAHSLFPLFSSSGKVESEVEMMAGAAMSCVKSIYRPIDVMQVRFLYVSGFRYCGIEPDRHYALEGAILFCNFYHHYKSEKIMSPVLSSL